MKKFLLFTGAITLSAALFLSSCKKSVENHQIYTPPVLHANPITDTMHVLGVPGTITAYYGHLLTTIGHYTVVGDIQINIGDTIFAQPGVTLCIENASCILVKGVFVSIGTQANPVIITDCQVTPVNTIGEPTAADPAWNTGAGWWGGIECDTSCTLLLLKWTQIWFSGGNLHAQEPIANIGAEGSTSYGIFFQRPTGNLIMEDCKMYGSCDDAVRISTGHFEVMRCVFEKMGYQGGDNVNIKSGGIGDFAYNLCIGNATNSSKVANTGGGAVNCNVCIYNNTYVDCGYRNTDLDKGSDIDYESGAAGASYNNLIVNCRVGFRVVGSPVADTFSLWYSNNFIYGDTSYITGQFYPNTGEVTKWGAYLPSIANATGYVYNPSGSTAYNQADAVALAGKNNPMFVNFPLPEASFPVITETNNYESPNNFNFRLQSNSPCINAGTTNFQPGYPLNACSGVILLSLQFAPSESPPCTDIGCYPYNSPSIGNQQ